MVELRHIEDQHAGHALVIDRVSPPPAVCSPARLGMHAAGRVWRKCPFPVCLRHTSRHITLRSSRCFNKMFCSPLLVWVTNPPAPCAGHAKYRAGEASGRMASSYIVPPFSCVSEEAATSPAPLDFMLYVSGVPRPVAESCRRLAVPGKSWATFICQSCGVSAETSCHHRPGPCDRPRGGPWTGQ